MKTKVFIIAALVMFSLASLVFTGCSDNNSGDHSAEQTLYYCPMHPEVTSDRPGVCPICNMDLVKRSENPEKDAAEMEGTLSLTKTGQILANVQTVPVKRENLLQSVTAFGYLDFTESGRRSVTSRFGGRIEKLYVDESGDRVRKGQLLFEIYSPDLIQAQNDYLLAVKNSNTGLISAQNEKNSFVNSSRKKLEIMGLTSEQIRSLEQSGTVQMTVGYYSPYSGTVIEKKIQEGMYVNEGAVIYELADLSTLWNISEIFADDLSVIKVGDNIKFTTSSYPGEQFTGRISFIYPVINSQSRTVKVRADVRNPGEKLKPQMYTETIIEKSSAESLVVPEGAVLFTGKKNVVWIKNKDNAFEPREIKLGIKSDGKYQVLSGLKEGELVAATGGYLIDSESQLRSGSTPGHQHGTGEEQQKPGNTSPDHSGHDISEMQKNNDNSLTESHSAHIFNEVCPVLGNPVSEEVKPVEYKGKLYGFCCAGCDTKFASDPEKYLKNLSRDGKSFIKI